MMDKYMGVRVRTEEEIETEWLRAKSLAANLKSDLDRMQKEGVPTDSRYYQNHFHDYREWLARAEALRWVLDIPELLYEVRRLMPLSLISPSLCRIGCGITTAE